MKTIDELALRLNNDYRKKGCWEGKLDIQQQMSFIARIHAEVSELFESLRHKHNGWQSSDKPIPLSAIEEELADCLILLLDFAKQVNIGSIDRAIQLKHEYNINHRKFPREGKLA